MSESIGVIGYCYEDRKTKRVGVLMERDEDKKVLSFLDEATGTPFTVTFASFRSNWRKYRKEENPVSDVPAEPESVDEPQMSEEDKARDFINCLSEVRDVRFTTNPWLSNETELFIDGVLALTMVKEEGGVHVTLLPDLYTYSSLKNHSVAGSLHFDAGSHLSVSFICDLAGFGDILQAIKQAAIEINLYGYTVEDDFEE